MFIKITGIEPQFKVYRMIESVEGKIYIGKTKRPLQERMKNHRYSQQYADRHFSDVGWNNVTVEIIDTANSDEELCKKEQIKITEYFTNHKQLLLNINNCYSLSRHSVKEQLKEAVHVHYSEIDLFPDNHWFTCQRKIDEYDHDVFKFIKNNKYIIKHVGGARKYISKCISKKKKNQLTNDEARSLIIAFLKDKPWRGKCEVNRQWNKNT